MNMSVGRFRFRLPELSGLVGPSGLEPPTSRLSGARSNQLSYEPIKLFGSLFSLLNAHFGGDDGNQNPTHVLRT